MLDLSYHIFCTCVFLGVCPLSPSPLKTPLPMIEIRCVMIFAGINFWFNNIHSLREPSLSPPKNPHKPLDYRDKEWRGPWRERKKQHLSMLRGPLEEPGILLQKKILKTSESWSWNVILLGDTLSRLFRLSTVNDKVRKPKAPQLWVKGKITLC